MINFFPDFVKCAPNATLSDVAGKSLILNPQWKYGESKIGWIALVAGWYRATLDSESDNFGKMREKRYTVIS